MNKYICHYEDPFSKNESVAEGGSIFDLKDGFWINQQGELAKASENKYWIPPSRIYYIEKQVVEDEEGKAAGK